MNLDTAEDLLAEVRRVRDQVIEQGGHIAQGWQSRLKREGFQRGADNLAHYLVLRRLDVRRMQAALAPWGLSSLGRVEGHVLPSLQAIIANLELICRSNEGTPRPVSEAFRYATEALARNTEEVFGSRIEGRMTRILVTLSAKAAGDHDHVRELLAAGMDCARINCARDGPEQWKKMIGNVRVAASEAGRTCRVMMDLAGPKIRTHKVRRPADRKKVVAGDKILLAFGDLSENRSLDFQTSCSLPEVLRQVGVGAPVSIKDGLIKGMVDEVRPDGLVMSVQRTPPDGYPLERQRGINFPGTDLVVNPLTKSDLASLDFAAAHADIISYSFVQRPEDIALLQSEIISRRGDGAPMPIVAKIETRLGFANLPEIMVQAAGSNPFAVMIARGDLAVEIGYERLSEVQEEILWLCEAAYVPVIWATQVLEGLVKRGMPTRGEFTDAAMAERAECVMLNKGPYIAEGVAVLDDVLRRMETHKLKRITQLRPLKAWQALYEPWHS
ncbi:MAG: pyruvate kinase [Gammaproteobacteria bacterium]